MRTGCIAPVLGLGIGIAPAARSAMLDASVLPKVEAATFEVVAAKPAHDPLTYEKSLPLDLMPYQQRTDKYHSIGTAFAIGPNRYVTAGHVLLTGLDSLWGPPSLRDASGQVYAIDKIEKFSLRKDFVVFSLASPPKTSATLEIDAKPALNQVVYAVGNALGTGVVIRDGLYTSNTPEQQDGAWKWIRFSAAASPGNSGGPLLDKDGKVIGVVLMKSANENLNYALPISQVVKAPDGVAMIDERVPYQFDLFDTTRTGTFKSRFVLPMSLADFNATFLKLRHTYVDGQLKALLGEDPGTLFPHGDGSARLLYGVPTRDSFPALITRKGNGYWGLSVNKGPKIQLSDNGYLAVGLVGHNLLFHLRKPDSLPATRLYRDPAKMMELMAKAGFMTRNVGPQKIKITSLGKPTLDTTHTDAWQRHWQVREWSLPFVNSKVMVLALPVPDGYVGFMRTLPVDREHDYLINLEAMTDFFYATWEGTLSQWKDYLENTALLPAAFKDIHMDIRYGHRFSYASKRLEFAVTPDLQKIDADSKLTLWFSYFRDHDKVVWDVADVDLAASPHDSNYVAILRNPDPTGNPDDSYRNEWNKVLHRQHPYDSVARDDNDVTKITGVAGVSADTGPTVLYTAYYDVEGQRSQDFMKTRLGMLMQSLHVYEH
jgi:hypothetical protein